MKPALVLGLALAANAMAADSTDNNELFVAPTGSHAQKYQGKYIMYDELADDELAQRYVHPPYYVPGGVAYDDDELLIRPLVPHISADDAADDELTQRYVHPPYYVPGGVAYDDDELVYARPLPVNFDEVADDELAQRYVHPPYYVPGGVAYDDELLAKKPRKDDSQRVKEHITSKGWTRPEAADDELVLLKKDTLPKNNFHRFEILYFDKETGQYTKKAADDELAVKYVHLPHLPAHEVTVYDDDELLARKPRKDDSQRIKEHITSKGWTRPEAADDELLLFNKDLLPNDGIRRFYTPYFDKATGQWKVAPGQYTKLAAVDDELAVKYVHLPHLPAHEVTVYDDDELLAKKPRKDDSQRIKEHITSKGWTRPEAADDELVLLKKDFLLKDAFHRFGGTRYFDKEAGQWKIAYDDDEFVAKKPRKDDSQRIKEHITSKGWTRPEAADDELLVAPTRDFNRHPFDANGHVLRDNIGRPVKPVLARFDEVADDEFAINQQIVHLPVELAAFDDDELVRTLPPVSSFRSFEEWSRFTKMMSEEVDNELAYLGHLLNERAQNSNEVKKAEKPSHGKTKEKSQMKRKFRPVADETPLAQN